MRPPWRSTIFRQIASPIPVPRILLARMETPKEAEELPGPLRVNADAVIPHGKAPCLFLPFRPYMDARRRAVAKLHGIVEEFLKDKLEVLSVGLDGR